MLKLDITKQTKKFLETLPPKQFRQVVNKILELITNPEPKDSIKLKGYPFRRTDIGEYRIIYRLEKDCIKIAYAGKRNDDETYRVLKRS